MHALPTANAHAEQPRPVAARNRSSWRSLAAIRTLAIALVLIGLGLNLGHDTTSLAQAASMPYDWLQFDGNAQHSGNNTQETIITSANVGTLTQLFQATLPGPADGAPVYLSGVSTSGGTRDLVFVTVKSGEIWALDAHSGVKIWGQTYGPGTCKINNGSAVCYTTSSPAVDPNRQYVYSYGLDGFVHKLQVADGSEVTTGGWPERATLKPWNEKGSSALSFATANGSTYLYVASAGYPGDQGDYQGHITAINLATGAQSVFNANCSDQAVHFVQSPGTPDCAAVQSAIWARAGVIYSTATNRIYMSTGNGDYNPSVHDWGDSVFALNPDGTGTSGVPLDAYTPANYAQLQSTDTDLGSTAPAILPVPAGSTVQHLALQSGKDGMLRLINLDNLSGQGGPGHTGGEVGTPIAVPQGNEVLTQPAVWTNPTDGATWVFIANGSGISGLRLALDGNNVPMLNPVWQQSTAGTSPIIANSVVYYASTAGVRGLDPTTGTQLWTAPGVSPFHWESPIVANGVLYITDGSGYLTAYGLPAAADFSLAVSPSSRTVSRGSNTTYAITVSPVNGLQGNVSLSISGLPSRTGGTFSPNPVAVSGSPGTSTLTITTARPSRAGTYTLVITGTGGAHTHSTTVTLAIQ